MGTMTAVYQESQVRARDNEFARQQMLRDQLNEVKWRKEPWRRPVTSDPDWVADLRQRLTIKEEGTHVFVGLVGYVEGDLPYLPEPFQGLINRIKGRTKGPTYRVSGQGTTDFLQTLVLDYGFILG